MSKCIGCGCDTEKSLCERCFRIRNYGEYKLVDVNNDSFFDILKSINLTNSLVLFVIDIFNFYDLNVIRKYLNNDILVVLTKRDILPKRVSDEKLIAYFDSFNLNYKDIVVVSSNKNYNFDLLFDLINKYKSEKDVYVVGFTNAGKSTLINKIIYNYSSSNSVITTSPLPSTTLDCINIDINDNLTLIDTPGILNDKSLYNLVDGNDLKKIIPKREIKPISFQIKGSQFIVIDKFCVVEVNDMNVVLFISNNLNVKRLYKQNDTFKFNKKFNVDNNDIVISGLGFIKCVGSGKIIVHTNYDMLVYTRNCLI